MASLFPMAALCLTLGVDPATPSAFPVRVKDGSWKTIQRRAEALNAESPDWTVKLTRQGLLDTAWYSGPERTPGPVTPRDLELVHAWAEAHRDILGVEPSVAFSSVERSMQPLLPVTPSVIFQKLGVGSLGLTGHLCPGWTPERAAAGADAWAAKLLGRKTVKWVRACTDGDGKPCDPRDGKRRKDECSEPSSRRIVEPLAREDVELGTPQCLRFCRAPQRDCVYRWVSPLRTVWMDGEDCNRTEGERANRQLRRVERAGLPSYVDLLTGEGVFSDPG
ncbi:MAG: hypothetical protein K1X89_03040 [Myxococcaceae bacterium]|nr:hypothetical protein [Myxococcaceae bacterium]